MIMNAKQAELNAVLSAAKAMCAAARTAPKTQGKDYLETCIVTGEEMECLAQRMEELGAATGAAFLTRDAGCVRRSQAVVLLGVKNEYHGLNGLCRYCNQADCAGCAAVNGICVYAPVDLGIAVGSAVSVAEDLRIDCRVMFSAGRSAMDLHYLPEGYGMVLGIPLSVSGKSPYFDRKKST